MWINALGRFQAQWEARSCKALYPTYSIVYLPLNEPQRTNAQHGPQEDTTRGFFLFLAAPEPSLFL